MKAGRKPVILGSALLLRHPPATAPQEARNGQQERWTSSGLSAQQGSRVPVKGRHGLFKFELFFGVICRALFPVAAALTNGRTLANYFVPAPQTAGATSGQPAQARNGLRMPTSYYWRMG